MRWWGSDLKEFPLSMTSHGEVGGVLKLWPDWKLFKLLCISNILFMLDVGVLWVFASV